MMRCFNTTWGDVFGNLTTIKLFSTRSRFDASSSKAQREGFQLTAPGLVDNRFQLGYPLDHSSLSSMWCRFLEEVKTLKVICLGLHGCFSEDDGVMSLARVTWLCRSWPEWDLQIKEPYGSCNLSSGEENQQGKDTTFIYLQWYIVSYTVSTIVQNFLYLKVAFKMWNSARMMTPFLWHRTT